jgi:hypothetical protein
MGIMDTNEITNKIEDWINNDYMKKLIVIREQYDPDKIPFLLKIKPSNPKTEEIPLSIFKPNGLHRQNIIILKSYLWR